MDAPGELIDVGGRRLHVLRRGSGAPTVVLESGGGGGSSVQDWPVLDRVAEFAHAVSYDRAGLGWSDPSPTPKTFGGMVADLDALLRSAGEAPPYVLVGGSFGGLLVRAYAARFPGKVGGVVMLDTADEQKYFPTMRRMAPMHEAELRDAAERAQRGELLAEAEPAIRAATGLNEITRAAMRHVLGLRSHFDAALDELRAAARATADEMRPGARGSLEDLPLIVLSAGKSAQHPAWQDGWADAQDRLAALSRRGVHIRADNNGHSLSLENPGLVAAAIEAVVRAARGEPFDFANLRRWTSFA
jgi:pimeloyl-ACP methyl ester carboxylesterase